MGILPKILLPFLFFFPFFLFFPVFFLPVFLPFLFFLKLQAFPPPSYTHAANANSSQEIYEFFKHFANITIHCLIILAVRLASGVSMPGFMYAQHMLGELCAAPTFPFLSTAIKPIKLT